jgi:glycosyltransferase involved in cell wall biosynthesis
LKDVIVSHGLPEKKITVIHNGVDFEKFQINDKTQSRLELGLEIDPFYIVFVGRLEPVKGLKTLIDAVDEFREQLVNTKIIFVGDGSLRAQLETQIHQKKMQDYFVFSGAQSHDSISKWYSAADIFCLPSLNEGHPNVVMEAIASGRPVVASDVGAIGKFVTNQVGTLFQAGDHKSLGMALLETKAKQYSPHIIRESISSMTWEANANKYFEVFQQVMSTL